MGKKLHKCIYCENMFMAYTYRNRQFCSKECFDTYQTGKPISQEHRQKISNSNKGIKNHFYGKTHSNETKLKMRLKKLGHKMWIGKKHLDSSKEKMSIAHKGEKSSLWRGGISDNPYGESFNNILRNQIRQRDNHICQLCGVPQIEFIKRFSIHHIDYDKQNNNSKNLITLCPSCHSKTHFHRAYWTSLFVEKVRKAYA